MSSDEDMREALVGDGSGKNRIMGVYTLLLQQAKSVGVDAHTLETYKKDFETALDKELNKFMSSYYFDSTKLDNLMNALVQTIDNYRTGGNDTPDSKVTLKGSGVSVSKTQKDAYNIIAERFNKAQKDFNAQMKQDGWAGDVADAFGRIYGSKNVASKVRADLKTAKTQIDELKTALSEGDSEFRAKFEEIFGIPYNAQNIKAYQDIENTYLVAAIAKEQEDYFKSSFSLLLSDQPLSEEGQMVTQSVSAGTSTYIVTATKAEVYKREFNKVASYMGKDGVALLNEWLNENAGPNASLDDKYKLLQQRVKDSLKNLNDTTTKACGGRSFSAVQRQYNNCYKAAYGVENDIMKRVTDYNISQQKGAGVVKAIGTVLMTVGGTALELASLGTATPAVAAVAATATAAAVPAVVEVTDRATSGKALDSLRNDGVLAWLKTTNEETDWASVAKTSLINGALTVVFMGQSYAVTGLCMKAGLGATATGVANGAGIAATGLGTEYLMTGEISVEGAIFTVVMAVVGGVMTVKSIKAASAAESQARAEQHALGIQAARRALGFEDGVEITPEGLKAQFQKLSSQGLSENNGLTLKVAYDFLTKNIADLNIAAPKPSAAAEPIGSMLDDIQRAAQKSKSLDASVVKNMIEQHPDVVEKLIHIQGPDGKPLFDAKDISSILCNCRLTIKDMPERLFAVLNNPEEIALISEHSSRAGGLYKAIEDPLHSTIKLNPAAFGVKPKPSAAAAKAPSKTAPAGTTVDAKATAAAKTSAGKVLNRFKRAVGLGGGKTLDSVLNSARKNGALIEEIAPGEYKVTQRYSRIEGKLKAEGASSTEYSTEVVSMYKDGNPEPFDVTRYTRGPYGRDNPVVQRTIRNGDNLTHYILDRQTGYGVEYSGYDAQGNKVMGQKQVVRVIDKDNKVLKEYFGEDIENALLAPSLNETDMYSQWLLDVKRALTDYGASTRIEGWQATGGTEYLVSSGKRFKPENFVREVKPEDVQAYTEFSSDSPAFAQKIAEYNKFARTRNLTIEEGSDGTLAFKNEKGQTVREVKPTRQHNAIESDTFYELNSKGEIVQSATRDANGNITSRTINEYRQWWGKACTVTLDYVNGKAHSGLWFKGVLTDPKTHSLETGISLFCCYAGK